MKGLTWNIQPHFIDIHYEVGGKTFDLHIGEGLPLNSMNTQLNIIAEDYVNIDCRDGDREHQIFLTSVIYEYNKRIEQLMYHTIRLKHREAIIQAERTDLKYIPIKPKGGDAATA